MITTFTSVLNIKVEDKAVIRSEGKENQLLIF